MSGYLYISTMGFCNLLSFLCCPKRYHRNNVLDRVKYDEVKLRVDEFEEVYREASVLVEVEIHD